MEKILYSSSEGIMKFALQFCKVKYLLNCRPNTTNQRNSFDELLLISFRFVTCREVTNNIIRAQEVQQSPLKRMCVLVHNDHEQPLLIYIKFNWIYIFDNRKCPTVTKFIGLQNNFKNYLYLVIPYIRK